MDRLFLLIVFAKFLQLVLPGLALAGEVRVVDQLGLVRASRVVQSAAQVTIELGRGSYDGEEFVCSLVSKDGIASEIEGRLVGKQSCEFRDVVAGTWQVHLTSTEVPIKRVKIE